MMINLPALLERFHVSDERLGLIRRNTFFLKSRHIRWLLCRLAVHDDLSQHLIILCLIHFLFGRGAVAHLAL